MAARRPAHKVAHPPGSCPNDAFNWTDCDRLGQKPCSAMLDARPEECSRKAVAEFEGKGYCGVHYASRVNGEIESKRIAIRRAELDQRITEHLAWIAEHPSVWDRKVDGGGGESHPASPKVPAPSPAEAESMGTGGPAVLRAPVWSASSGDPAPVRK